MFAARLLWLLSIWYMKSTFSLSKLYFNINNRKGVSVKLFRKYEVLSYKLGKKRLDKEFFCTCLDLEMCPKFLKFKPPQLKAYANTKHMYQQAVRQQLEVVDNEIDAKRKQWIYVRKMLYDHLNVLERRCLEKLLKTYLDNKLCADKDRINKKLKQLWNRNKSVSPDCLINLSSKSLSICEQNVLYLGLNHHVLPKKVNEDEIKAQVERLIKGIVWNNDISVDYDTKDEIKREVHTFVKSVRRICSKRSNQAFHKTIRKLSSDTNVVCCKFDKGNGVVLLDRQDYNQKCYAILSDETKFKKLDSSHLSDIILKKRSSLQNYVYRYLRNSDKIEKSVYDKLYDVGSSPGKFYGLVKVHKDGYPVRPVVSMIDTPEYGIAKWLDGFIKPNIPSKYMLDSTDQFVDIIKDFPVYPNDKLVSFDVKSLYTNIPLKETVGIVADYMYSDNAICTPPLSKTIFKKLLLLVTEGNFIFNGDFYKQIDGLAMGGPLGPTLANFFLAHLEKSKMFDSCPGKHQPKLYLRYIDDIFAIFDESQSYDIFFNLINSIHNNLEFTVEVATTTLPFLDVNVKITEFSVDLSVYRKATNTNVLLNFNCTAPSKWKAGLVYCMLHRAWKICSSLKLFYDEVENLRKVFNQNGYPVSFFNRIYSLFYKRIMCATNVVQDEEEMEQKFIIKLPYIPIASKLFSKRFKSLILKKFNVNVDVVYSSCKLSSFFSLKDKTPLSLTSKVVYKFTCLRDANVTYIGQTNRPLCVRMDEHLSTKSKSKTAVRKHIDNCLGCKKHTFVLNDFKVLKRCRTQTQTRVHEALLIKKRSPLINKQLHQSGVSFVLNVY